MAQAVVIGGQGAVGGWIATRLADGFDCTTIDPAGGALPAGIAYLPGDPLERNAALEEAIAAADVIVLAVSADLAHRFLERHLRRLKAGGTLIDMLSVKAKIGTRLLAERADLACAGLNPMFRPGPTTAGGIVLRSVYRDGGAVGQITAGLAAAGHDIRDIGADDHDRVLALVQCLCHASVLGIGEALSQLGGPPDGIATPPYRILAALVARVFSGAPHVYWEIQKHNAYAAEARRSLIDALQRLDRMVAKNDAVGFRENFVGMQSSLDGMLPGASEDAARLIASLVPRAGTRPGG